MWYSFNLWVNIRNFFDLFFLQSCYLIRARETLSNPRIFLHDQSVLKRSKAFDDYVSSKNIMDLAKHPEWVILGLTVRISKIFKLAISNAYTLLKSILNLQVKKFSHNIVLVVILFLLFINENDPCKVILVCHSLSNHVVCLFSLPRKNKEKSWRLFKPVLVYQVVIVWWH